MYRDTELAHEVSLMPDVKEKRHRAIDKLTAAHLIVDLLSRATSKEITPIEEIELEERVEELTTEAVHEWWKYRKYKMKRYETLLHEKSSGQTDTINKGNRLIADTLHLARERGIE